MGYIEPLSESEKAELGQSNEFVNECVGTNIPPEYYTSCEKGCNDTFNEGSLVGGEVEGVRVRFLVHCYKLTLNSIVCNQVLTKIDIFPPLFFN